MLLDLIILIILDEDVLLSYKIQLEASAVNDCRGGGCKYVLNLIWTIFMGN
jgi:hypothetical protein